MYEIKYAVSVAKDLAALRASKRVQVLDTIEVQLRHEPARQTRNRKIIVGLTPPWEHAVPIWELRAGVYRVFYDVDEEASTVIVRAVRHKPRHKRTEEIL